MHSLRHRLVTKVGTSLHHPSLSPSTLSLPSLTRLSPSSLTLLSSSEIKSRSPFDSPLRLRLALSRRVRTSDRPSRSEASRIRPRFHLPEQASISAPAFLLLSLSHTLWAAPIARCVPTSEQRLTNPSIDLGGSERLRPVELRPLELIPSANRCRVVRIAISHHRIASGVYILYRHSDLQP